MGVKRERRAAPGVVRRASSHSLHKHFDPRIRRDRAVIASARRLCGAACSSPAALRAPRRRLLGGAERAARARRRPEVSPSSHGRSAQFLSEQKETERSDDPWTPDDAGLIHIWFPAQMTTWLSSAANSGRFARIEVRKVRAELARRESLTWSEWLLSSTAWVAQQSSAKAGMAVDRWPGLRLSLRRAPAAWETRRVAEERSTLHGTNYEVVVAAPSASSRCRRTRRSAEGDDHGGAPTILPEALASPPPRGRNVAAADAGALDKPRRRPGRRAGWRSCWPRSARGVDVGPRHGEGRRFDAPSC